MVCDVPEGLAMPMQLILRDRYGNDIDTLDVIGPNMGQGVCLLEGYEGFYHAERTQVDSDEGAYTPGAEPTPYPRIEKRSIKFILGTQGRDAAEWEAIETRLWWFIKFNRDCVIRVYSMLSGWRELKFRFTRKPRDLLTRVPGTLTVGVWEIEATAYQPFWESEMLTASIPKGAMVEEVDPATGELDPGSGVWQGRIPMWNPADTPLPPEFSSNELTTTTTVWLPDALTDRMVPLPALGVGKEFYVRTNPLQQTLMVRDNGQDWAKMKANLFNAEVPPGKITPVMQRIWIQGGTADTEVMAFYPQLWDRMFGGESSPMLENVEW